MMFKNGVRPVHSVELERVSDNPLSAGENAKSMALGAYVVIRRLPERASYADRLL
jgi:hypothetical protein